MAIEKRKITIELRLFSDLAIDDSPYFASSYQSAMVTGKPNKLILTSAIGILQLQVAFCGWDIRRVSDDD